MSQETIEVVENHLRDERSNVKSIKSGELKESWYTACENMREMGSIAIECKDDTLLHHVYDISQRLDDIYDHLNKTYNWD
jgi:hypothetical protein